MTREEIADEVAYASRGMYSTELADAVRALPVIATCGQCARYDVLPATDLRGIQGWCGARRQQVDARGSVPPWCPLRGKP